MTRPHERLGLPEPISRRLPRGIAAWNLAILGVTMALVIGYVVRVNDAAAKGFQLRQETAHVEALRTEVLSLQGQMTESASIQSLANAAVGMGMTEAGYISYLNPPAHTYALAK